MKKKINSNDFRVSVRTEVNPDKWLTLVKPDPSSCV